MKILQPPVTDNSIESDYSASTSLAHRRKFAQFFTPFAIADLMSHWLIKNKELKTVLEPAFGLGVFSRAILARNEQVMIRGFEVDTHIFEKMQPHFEEFDNISIQLKDYIYNDWDKQYDGIICNPPYFKFHDYDNKNIIKEIETHLQCKLTGFTNLYTLFLLKSIHQLTKNGRCAYIIPSEFLNSDYGKLVKTYLIHSKTLRHIIVIDFEENIFEDALTTACILLCANDNASEKVQFSNITTIKDIAKIAQLIENYPNFKDTKQIYHFSELNPAIKWKAYYQPQHAIHYKHLVPFSNFAKVVRGIATGSNEYFTFNSTKIALFSIDEKFLLPCICKAMDVKKSFFTTIDFEELKANDKSIYLFNATFETDKYTTDYIQKGETEAIDKKFLTTNRNPWYALENRPPAPIWVSVFNRNGLRFIRNEANISNLTCFHCIYPKQNNLFSKVATDLLFAYLLTDTAKRIFEDNGREYGNGLQKFEPNDINKGKMLNLELIDATTEAQILILYAQYRKTVLNNENGENYIHEINALFIEKFT
jgi:adenine-specific DNA-methyltransferase